MTKWEREMYELRIRSLNSALEVANALNQRYKNRMNRLQAENAELKWHLSPPAESITEQMQIAHSEITGKN